MKADDVVQLQRICANKVYFLGVGNSQCLHENLQIAIFLVGVIIVLSLGFERFIEFIRGCIHCPQLLKIVNRVFEEIMILGFLSMTIFILNTSGLLGHFFFRFGELTKSEKLYFVEFFHYVVFIAMLYYIFITLLLLFSGTVMPQILWSLQRREAETTSFPTEESLVQDVWSHNHTPRQTARNSRQHSFARPYRSGLDGVAGSRSYRLLKQRYKREGWTFLFNIRKQWQLWKSVEILAYNICEDRSAYIYKNAGEMERLFHVKPEKKVTDAIKGRTAHQSTDYSQNILRASNDMYKSMEITFDQYHVLCMRNLLYHISHLHYGSFFILLVVCIAPSTYPEHERAIVLATGGFLLLTNVVISLKVLQILRGIVDDRLHVISSKDLEKRGQHTSIMVRRRPSLRIVALAVRSTIRMQLSALSHHQLHHHDSRFWFRSPRLLLRLFQFATIGQAFYLVWLTLVQIYPAIKGDDSKNDQLFFMLLFPFLALFIIMPLTMPSLLLVMSLTGVFVELNSDHHGLDGSHKKSLNNTKYRIRFLRSSYLQEGHDFGEQSEMDRHASPTCERTSISGAPFVRFDDAAEDPFASETSFARAYARESTGKQILQQRYASPKTIQASPSQHRTDLNIFEEEKSDIRSSDEISKSIDVFFPDPSTVPFKSHCSKYGGYTEEERM